MSSPNPHRFRATLFSIRFCPARCSGRAPKLRSQLNRDKWNLPVFPNFPISSKRSRHRIHCALRTCICDATQDHALATDEMLTIDPSPRRFIGSASPILSISKERTLIETRSKSSSDSASGLLRIGIPALLTIIFTPSPCVASRTCSACRDPAPRGERSASKITGSF